MLKFNGIYLTLKYDYPMDVKKIRAEKGTIVKISEMKFMIDCQSHIMCKTILPNNKSVWLDSAWFMEYIELKEEQGVI